MDKPKRIETVARALARFRLGKETFVSSLNPDLVGKLRQSAEDKLWPALVGEASAVIEAIDASGQDANGPILEHQEAAAIPREAAPVSEPETVDKGVAIRADQAAMTGAPSRETVDKEATIRADHAPTTGAPSRETVDKEAPIRTDHAPTTGAPPRETVDKEAPIRTDHAPTTGAPPRELGDALPGAVQPLQDPQPAEMTPSRSALPDATSEGLRSALAALIATGRSRSKS